MPSEGAKLAKWGEFATSAPHLASAGRELLFQYGHRYGGAGLAYLATVARDGTPRIHPICPFIARDGLYAFIDPSPKRNDLSRDGRYALHARSPSDVEDEFSIRGRAMLVRDQALRCAAAAAHHVPVPDDEAMFEFLIAHALLARYQRPGAWPPTYTRWRTDLCEDLHATAGPSSAPLR